MSFNIHHGIGTDKRLDLQRIAKLIESAGPDIIGLNEVDRFFSERSQFMDQAKWLAKELGMEYAYGAALTIESPDGGKKRQFGNALLTRFPIQSHRNHPFDFLPKVIEDRALLEVNVRVDNKELAVFVTHLSLAPFQHKKQAAFILGKIAKVNAPAFIMGDWNMTPSSRAWRTVTASLNDVWSETNKDGRGGTFPSRRPFRRLDYIFANAYVETHECEVINEEPTASDHLPVLANLSIRERRNDLPAGQ
ncbi:endonuclease [Neobacillus notoginsengisoli]|uniref:Endonuclease n=1 Tax=Neobacillus notoginsengisoli TaxID=1578198 RepID=A0A417YXY5_9BACI|nr:endonuclease/exonuclease/phosphatase family protein [Neobacillus notoginsengisoli]RHW42318.1 endonuclease [Neobacillus notoginsengisoli]